MPVTNLWGLVVGVALLALGLAYKVAELTHRVDRINQECETLRSELDALQKAKDKEISDIQKLHLGIVAELNEKLAESADASTTTCKHVTKYDPYEHV